jgi:hypothetical protein
VAHLGIVADATKKVVGDARRAATAPGNLVRAFFLDFDVEEARGARDDLLELLGFVVIEALVNLEAREERRSEKAAACGGANQGKAGQSQANAASVGTLVNNDVELEIFHCGIEVFLDCLLEAMDFVDEEDVAFLKVGEKPGEIARFLDGRSAGALDVGTHGFGEDVCQCGFAETGWAAEEDVVDGFVALLGGGNGDLEAFFDLSLACEFGEKRGP